MKNERMELDPNYSPEMVKEQLPIWLEKLNALRKVQHDAHFAILDFYPVEIEGGRKYIKLAYNSSCQRFVYCFVRAADGAILMSATWKAPALNFPRGNIFNEELEVNAFGQYKEQV